MPLVHHPSDAHDYSALLVNDSLSNIIVIWRFIELVGS